MSKYPTRPSSSGMYFTQKGHLMPSDKMKLLEQERDKMHQMIKTAKNSLRHLMEEAVVIVCDSDPISSEHIDDTLCDLGYTVITTDSCEECLSLMSKLPSIKGLIINPEIDGIETVLSMGQYGPSIRIVISKDTKIAEQAFPKTYLEESA